LLVAICFRRGSGTALAIRSPVSYSLAVYRDSWSAVCEPTWSELPEKLPWLVFEQAMQARLPLKNLSLKNKVGRLIPVKELPVQ
jgi:hypothetical protein